MPKPIAEINLSKNKPKTKQFPCPVCKKTFEIGIAGKYEKIIKQCPQCKNWIEFTKQEIEEK